MSQASTLAAMAAEVKEARTRQGRAHVNLDIAKARREPPERIEKLEARCKELKAEWVRLEINLTAERAARREAKANRAMDRHVAERKAAFPDRAVIIKSLGMLRNDNDGETLNAARAVERIRAKLGLPWSQLIVQIVPSYDPGVE